MKFGLHIYNNVIVDLRSEAANPPYRPHPHSQIWKFGPLPEIDFFDVSDDLEQFFFLKTKIFTESDSFRDIIVLKLETSKNCLAGLGTSRNFPLVRNAQELNRRVGKRPKTAPQCLKTSRNCPAGLGRQVRRTWREVEV